MYILWGIITALITTLLEFIFLKGSFSLHDFMPGIVFPAGGWIDGALGVSGIYLYLKISHKHAKIRHRIISVIIAFTTFWLIYFMTYYASHLNEKYTFFNYLNLVFNTAKVIGIGNGIVLTEETVGSEFGKALFLLELLGFCIGGLSSGVIAIQAKDFCKRCKTDFTRKKLYSFNVEFFDDEISEMKKALKSKESFKQFIKRENELVTDNPFIDVALKYCMGCKTAYIEYKHMLVKEGKNKEKIIVEDKDRYKVIEAPYEIC